MSIDHNDSSDGVTSLGADFSRAVLNSVSAHIVVVDPSGTIIAVNDAWTSFAKANGDPSGAIAGIGKNYLTVCQAAEENGDLAARDVRLGILSVMRGEVNRFAYEYPCNAPTERRWFSMNVSRMPDSKNVVIAHENITARKQAEEALRASHDDLERRVMERTVALERRNTQLREEIAQRERIQQQLLQAAKVFDSALEAILIADEECRIVKVNRAFSRITGYEPHEVLGLNPRILSSGRHDENFYEEFWQSLNKSGMWQGEIWNRRKNGEIYPAWESVTVRRAPNGQVQEYISVFSDISAIKQAEQELAFLAHHDALTGLANRLLFNAQLDQALLRARRHRKRFGLLFIDMDNFKFINDRLGHPQGDLYLKAVAELLVSSVRSQDSVARLGGDEFAILIEDLTNVEDAGRLANKLVETLSRPMPLAGHDVASSASIGIAIFPDDADDGQALLKVADSAMYLAKESGRNTARFFQPELSARTLERVSLEHSLRQAMSRNELVLHYQPIVELETLRCVGVEALLRWNSPERGLVMPDTFIPVAENTRLIHPIGRWVLSQAFKDLARWQSQGLMPLRLAVNVSWRQFAEEGFAEQLLQLLGAHGLRTRDIQLDLEITESTLRSSWRAVEDLSKLRQEGVHVIIDDFGTGYSSLAQLMSTPVDGLKIDRGFLKDIPRDTRSEAIIRTVIELASGLGLAVVGEGVENEAQLEFLRAEGCGLVQGFLLGEPVPASRVPEIVTLTEGAIVTAARGAS